MFQFDFFPVAIYTLKIAILSTLVSFAIGFPAAFFCAKRKFLFRNLLLSFSSVPFCIPSLIAALAFVSFFGMNGALNVFLMKIFNLENPPVTFLYSTTGIIMAHGFYNFPLVMSVVAVQWENLNDENEKSARLLGAGEIRIFFTITLKRLSGSICSAILPVFLSCFFSFMIVLLFSKPGTSTLEVEIFQTLRSTFDLKSVILPAIFETIIAFSAVILYSYFSRKKNESSGIDFRNKEKVRLCNSLFETKSMKILEISIFVILMFLIFLFFVCPFLGVIISSFCERKNGVLKFSLLQYKELFSSAQFWTSVLNSFVVAFFTGFFCIFLAFFYSSFVKLNGLEKNVIFQSFPFLPMTFSSVVFSQVLLNFFKRGNPVLLVIAETFLYWPVAYRQIQSGMEKIKTETENAAKILSKNSFDSILRIYFPSVKKNVISAFSFCFAISMGDTTLPLVLSIPEFSTLALYTYRLSGSYRFNRSCASGVILGLICILITDFSKKFSSPEKLREIQN